MQSLTEKRYFLNNEKHSIKDIQDKFSEGALAILSRAAIKEGGEEIIKDFIVEMLDDEMSQLGAEILINGLTEDERLQETINANAEDGKIMMVIDSMDCDGVRVTGQTQLIEANALTIKEAHSRIMENAEGPTYVALDKPSNADKYAIEEEDTYAIRMGY